MERNDLFVAERFSKITGVGLYLPSAVSNDELVSFGVASSDEWIVQRTGIKQRRVASRGEGVDFMAIEAGRRALEMANANLERKAQMIIVSTNTASTLEKSRAGFPAVGAYVQNSLKEFVEFECGFFDVVSGCSGVNYGLAIGDSFIKAGLYDRVLVVGADRLWGITDLDERGTASVLSDGASGYVLDVSDSPGFIAHKLRGRGECRSAITSELMNRRSIFEPNGEKIFSPAIQMNGREVYKFVVNLLVDTFAGFNTDDEINPLNYRISISGVRKIAAHQANLRMFEAAADRICEMPELGLSRQDVLDRIITTIQVNANSSVASQGPPTYEILFGEKKVEEGSHILMMGYGAGLSWGINHYIA